MQIKCIFNFDVEGSLVSEELKQCAQAKLTVQIIQIDLLTFHKKATLNCRMTHFLFGNAPALIEIQKNHI